MMLQVAILGLQKINQWGKSGSALVSGYFSLLTMLNIWDSCMRRKIRFQIKTGRQKKDFRLLSETTLICLGQTTTNAVLPFSLARSHKHLKIKEENLEKKTALMMVQRNFLFETIDKI